MSNTEQLARCPVAEILHCWGANARPSPGGRPVPLGSHTKCHLESMSPQASPPSPPCDNCISWGEAREVPKEAAKGRQQANLRSCTLVLAGSNRGKHEGGLERPTPCLALGCARGSQRGWHPHTGGAWNWLSWAQSHGPPSKRNTPLIAAAPYHEGGKLAWVGACPLGCTHTRLGHPRS